ncbi:hypothetical protein [Stenotrophomonas daejeonensis]|uniref:hypothetical protein n=1 Tax=Stenotrophomonas daejeonensis TaxID=659018 RepID=UPI00128F7223|nr:hypothetical protein [Stenotrophomonas daejeonensis]
MTQKEIPYAKSWLLFFLIASVGGGILGALAGAIIGGILGAIGVPLVKIGVVTGIFGFAVGIPISFLAFKWSVGKYIVTPIVKATQKSA